MGGEKEIYRKCITFGAVTRAQKNEYYRFYLTCDPVFYFLSLSVCVGVSEVEAKRLEQGLRDGENRGF